MQLIAAELIDSRYANSYLWSPKDCRVYNSKQMAAVAKQVLILDNSQ